MIDARESKDEAILMLLADLCVIYWRPDFTAWQSTTFYAQYLNDLRPYPFAEIAGAIEKYRQSPEKFYPEPGQLLAIIQAVPSWDVISKGKHIAGLLAAARTEINTVVEQKLLSAAIQTRPQIASSR